MADDPHIEETTVPLGGASNAKEESPGGVALPSEAVAPISPAAAPATPPPPPQKNINADIAKILREVKLPERRIESAPSVTPKEQAPAFGAMPSFSIKQEPPPPEKKEVASAAAPAASVPAESESFAESPISSVHTMKTDLQETVRERKMSVVRAAAMQEERRHDRSLSPMVETSNAPRKIGRTLFIGALALLLLGAAGAVLYAGITVFSPQQNAPAPVSPSLIFTENQISFPIDSSSGSALKQALATYLSQPGTIGSITRIIPTTAALASGQGERSATLSEFFAALGVQPPPDLLRSLSGDFFFGVHAADVPAPVFIIPVLSYDRAFAGMLAWESAIDGDLSPIVKRIPAVTASLQGGLPQARQFKDLVVRNYDVRGLEDDSGALVLYYSFPTPNLLIIATSPYTFPEVLSRLQAERRL